MLTLLMTGDFEVHEGVRVGDGEVRTDKDTEELVAGEAAVAIFGVGGFPLCHPLEAFEDVAGVHSNDDAFVAEFAEETSIAGVNSRGYSTKIADIVVERVAVDMVDDVACRDLAFEG
jgi:hypothetical protein